MELKEDRGLSLVQISDEAEVLLGGGRAVNRFEDVMPGGPVPSVCPLLRKFCVVALIEGSDTER
jgi:hypothetical protein